ncbi:hypothetical protein RDI58_017491 [Solanum bulbocastanum]|uniref:Uncharacterized protein n=1 Tax=Solanum bulbocastanum TaxID=147425 RepID=A0AAN8TF42_SOLBU
MKRIGDNDTFISNSPHSPKAIEAICFMCRKRRNTRRHIKETSYHKMYYQCELIVHHLIKVKFHWMRNIPHQWKDIKGDLIYAEAQNIGITTSMEA